MSDSAEDAALKALASMEEGGADTLERHLNMEQVYEHEAFLRSAEKPQLCPFCSMLWDQAEAERLLAADDHEGYRRWYDETVSLPVNAQGDDFGHRPLTD